MFLKLFLPCAAFVGQVLTATLVSQPVIWEDLADLDIFRVGNDFYYSASTMHYSPGAPILHSKDLVNWEYIGHSVPSLDFGDKYNLKGGNAYVKGVYASSLRRRPSDGQWFWVGCVEYSRSYIYTASSPTGPWTQHAYFPNQCYYDCGLLFDDDGTPYIAYGSTTINVAKMAKDLKSQVSTQAVFKYDVGFEGSRMYKIKGSYYILNDYPGNMTQYALKASSAFGPYTSGLLSNGPKCPISGGGPPHQGGIVDDPQGNWYYMAFCDAYPGGRMPVLAPINFNSQGFPTLPNVNSWPTSVMTPMQAATVPSLKGTDNFTGTALGPQWEWNHNPTTSAFTVNSGLTLRTSTVTNDLYAAPNTLTHRILGPSSTAIIKLTYTGMNPGDRSGLVLLRDSSAWIGVLNNNGVFTVGLTTGLTLTSGSNGWTTTSTGSLQTSSAIPSSGDIYLRATANILPSGPHTVQFAYSTDGVTFKNLGNTFTMVTSWQFFMGYRFGIFNYATQSSGGSVKVSNFTLS